ncbi:prephenate dehydratase [Gordonia hirsuta DSM 44140 = NBRC 16056]|uniref:Prephenate dehydratase n=1 Tax=Gordonia hirsuta DSM 44140 = NBRC 16056 TaxID=1121927 RepID=L7LDF2_9ACTN|nr:prephenate dehydratase [Gordonia hirsuta]GAC58058.1 prephenate dehydratase [Gordonia hirsuta DSM 44140 = NBRC 16056]
MPVFAYFGPAGTFTEMALKRLLHRGAVAVDGSIRTVPADSPAAAIAQLRRGEADYACVPIESSLEGSVPATMDALVPAPGERRVQAYAEVSLDIAFTIAARQRIDPAQVRTIAAYPVASAQVRDSVQTLFPNAQFVVASSNAGAAQDVVHGRADAAVTTAVAAELHQLTPLAEGVADSADARTRFLLLGPAGPPPERTGSDRTSVILDLVNRPGALVTAMTEFADRGVDLTRIESRPRRGEVPGQYRFFLDAAGHLDDDAVGEALRALYRSAERVVFLGSWPVDRTIGATAPPDHGDSLRWFAELKDGGD